MGMGDWFKRLFQGGYQEDPNRFQDANSTQDDSTSSTDDQDTSDSDAGDFGGDD